MITPAILLLVLLYLMGHGNCIISGPEELLVAAATKGFLIDKKLAIHGPPIGAPVVVLGGPPPFFGPPPPFGGPFAFGGGPLPPPFFGPGPVPPFFGPGAPF
ncbi:hypothetical protein LSTR_LSTR007571 [Laodelphax striatellus]|uniref:Uncharacterized protein n=1 Tax=Laodelphax striatellus TaxID=195883 RepID=A0A482XRU2_LAOST|nr:hypothetical protein LSTR_LSTR007571 [Laodelphax striatellus]